LIKLLVRFVFLALLPVTKEHPVRLINEALRFRDTSAKGGLAFFNLARMFFATVGPDLSSRHRG
jgi:hypothetical protein